MIFNRQPIQRSFGKHWERVAPIGAKREVLLDRAAASKMPREDDSAKESQDS